MSFCLYQDLTDLLYYSHYRHTVRFFLLTYTCHGPTVQLLICHLMRFREATETVGNR